MQYNLKLPRQDHWLLTRSVAPGFVVGREDAQVTTPDKLLVVHAEQRVCRRQELWVEDDLKTTVPSDETSDEDVASDLIVEQ